MEEDKRIALALLIEQTGKMWEFVDQINAGRFNVLAATAPRRIESWAEEPVSPPPSEISEAAGGEDLLPQAEPTVAPVREKTDDEKLLDEWELLAADVQETLEWRDQTWEREKEVFDKFGKFLARVGNYGRHRTEPLRKKVERAMEIHAEEKKVRDKHAKIDELRKKELEAIDSAQRQQQARFASAKKLQEGIGAIRKERLALEGRVEEVKRCPICKLEGPRRGRDCPNRRSHGAYRRGGFAAAEDDSDSE